MALEASAASARLLAEGPALEHNSSYHSIPVLNMTTAAWAGVALILAFSIGVAVAGAIKLAFALRSLAEEKKAMEKGHEASLKQKIQQIRGFESPAGAVIRTAPPPRAEAVARVEKASPERTPWSFGARDMVAENRYSAVYRVVMPLTGQAVAVKRVSRCLCQRARKDAGRLLREASVAHPNVMWPTGFVLDKGHSLLLLYPEEHIGSGTLRDLLRRGCRCGETGPEDGGFGERKTHATGGDVDKSLWRKGVGSGKLDELPPLPLPAERRFNFSKGQCEPGLPALDDLVKVDKSREKYARGGAPAGAGWDVESVPSDMSDLSLYPQSTSYESSAMFSCQDWSESRSAAGSTALRDAREYLKRMAETFRAREGKYYESETEGSIISFRVGSKFTANSTASTMSWRDAQSDVESVRHESGHIDAGSFEPGGVSVATRKATSSGEYSAWYGHSSFHRSPSKDLPKLAAHMDPYSTPPTTRFEGGSATGMNCKTKKHESRIQIPKKYKREEHEDCDLLNWRARFQIALGLARGLAFLHHKCSPPLIHLDISSNTVFVDNNKQAKLCDAELSNLLDPANCSVEDGNVFTDCASEGYVAPECGTDIKGVARSCNVYSYGVVLLELLTGKEASGYIDQHHKHLVSWVKANASSQLQYHDAIVIFDGRITDDMGCLRHMLSVLRIAMLCISPASCRPDMQKVVQLLEKSDSRGRFRRN